MPKDAEQFEELDRFRGHEQAPEGVPLRDASEARVARGPRPQGAASTRSSVVRTRAHAAPGAGFKKCCMQSGHFDGVDRDHHER